MGLSWSGSPSRTTLAPARAARSGMRPRWRGWAMPATAQVVAGVAVGRGESGRGGGLAGTGAADEEGEVGAGGGVEDGGALLGGEPGRLVERAADLCGVETQALARGEVLGGPEHLRFVAQVVGRGVVGDAAGVLAHGGDLAPVEGAVFRGRGRPGPCWPVRRRRRARGRRG